MTREQEIKEMAKVKASHITSDKDMQVAFADALRSGAEWADSHRHWISVEDGLPKEDGMYIFLQSGIIYTAMYYKSIGLNRDVTHWMPLPQPPKKGGTQ